MAVSNLQLVTELYIAYFNRAPDPAGLNAWIADLNAGATITQVANAFANSGEAKALYPFLTINTIPDAASASGFVNSVYNNLLNRAPDADGLNFWTTQLDTGKITPGQFILAVVQSVNAQTGTADAATLANKVTVADFYEAAVANLNAQFSIAAATAAIAGVNGTAASVTAAEAAITATVAHNTFTLTGNADTISDPTGIGHDVVNAPLVIGPLGLQTQSLNVGDTIALTGPSNIANLTLGGTIGAVWPAGTTISGAQTINFTNVGNILPIPGLLPAVINGNDITGMTTANMVNSAASVLIGGNLLGLGATGLPTLLTTVGMTNTGVQTFALEIQNAVLAAATAPALTVNLQGVGANTANMTGSPATFLSTVFSPFAPLINTGTQDGSLWVGSDVIGNPGYTSMTFNVTGNNAVQLGTFLSNALTSVTIAGAGGLLLDGTASGLEGANVKTITSTATGDVIITGAALGFTPGGLTGQAPSPLGIAPALAGQGGFLATNLALTSVTTGAGNDFVDISSMTPGVIAANGLAVDLGTGINELVVGDAVADSATALTFYKNVQVLGVTGVGAAGTAGEPGAVANIYDVINVANLAGVNEIQFVDGTMFGPVKITNAQSGFTLDMGAVTNGGGGFDVEIDAAAAIAGGAAIANVNLGLSNGLTTAEGVLVTKGFGVLNIASNGFTPIAPTFNRLEGIVALNPTVGSETVNISGNDALQIGTITANQATATGISATAIGHSIFEVGNGTFLNDTSTGTLRLEGMVKVASIDATKSGGLFMEAMDTANQGTLGVDVFGSATKLNFLAGSLGNDVIKQGAGGGTVITEGGGDNITLATHAGKGDLVDLFVGADATAHNAVVYNGTAGSTVAAGGLAQQGFWGVAPGGAALALNTKLGGFGTSADQSVVSGFNVNTDAVELAPDTWTGGGVGGYFGLLDVNGNPITAASVVQFDVVNSGGTLGLGTNAGANIVVVGDGATFANAAALATAIETRSFSIFYAFGAVGQSADILFAYQGTDGNAHLADVHVLQTGAGTQLGGPDSEVIASDMVQLTGVTTAALKTTDFHFVA